MSTMSQQTTPSSTPVTLSHLQARIEQETPWLHVLGLISEPHWYVHCRDPRNHNIHVGFTTEAECSTYVHLLGKGGTR